MRTIRQLPVAGIVRQVHLRPSRLVHCVDAHDFFRIEEVSGNAKEKHIHDAYHRDVCPYAKRKGENNRQCEARGFAQHAEGEAEVLKESFDEDHAALGAIVFLYGFDGAEFQEGLAARFVGREAAAKIFGGLESDVALDLILQALVIAAQGCEIRETAKQAPESPHGKSPALTLKKRSMIAAVCSQPRASAWSSLRPLRVRR